MAIPNSSFLIPNSPKVLLAYLISAYRDPEHLRRLIDTLDGEAHFYVHIDANVDDRPFRRCLPAKVRFVPRHRVSWGGWEQVEYQHELLRAALASGEDYDYLFCLSAQDFPLWSNRRIREFLAAHPGAEWIGGHNLTHTDNAAQRRKITRYHPFRDLFLPSPWLKNKMVVAARHLLAWSGLRRRPQVELGGRLCDVYFGSDYWALTLGCARHVCHVLDTEPALRRYFRTTFVPSELCIQTIVFNSPFAPHAQFLPNPYPGLTALTPLHFIDYGACIRELTEEDFPRLQASGKMFCRKIVSGKSDALVRKILAARAAD